MKQKYNNKNQSGTATKKKENPKASVKKKPEVKVKEQKTYGQMMVDARKPDKK